MKASITVVAVLFTGAVFLNSCSDRSKNSTAANLAAGRQLMQTHCGSCHQSVPPDMLSRDIWLNKVLPAMAPKLGVNVWQNNQYYVTLDTQESSALSYSDWMKIVRYFEEEAPKQLKLATPPVPLKTDWTVFELRKPKTGNPSIATTVLVAFDPYHSRIYSSDEGRSNVVLWNHNLEPFLTRHMEAPAVDVSIFRNKRGALREVFTTIGTMRAVNDWSGKVLSLSADSMSGTEKKIIASGLSRPVKAVPADFNNDGLRDWIVCSFGHNYGGLYLYEQESDHQFSRRTIREVPGTTDLEVGDFNGDGWPDLMVLFAHADEGIWMFVNDRNGGFTSERILQFSPVSGSTSFQLADFNRDGKPDILYTSGDNADYSAILKPYHGVYIYLNKGNFNYEQAYFYPVNGTTKAMAADFDLDGDLDMAAISFFADLKNNPAESFIFFEQNGNLNFIPHAVPVQEFGRWISMDVGDFEGDGDPDIVLGNYSGRFLNTESISDNWDTQLPFVLLENKTK